MHRLEDSTEYIDVYEALLERRSKTSETWGLQFGYGEEPRKPIVITSIRPGSPADRIGLRQGDEVTEIGDSSTASMTHEGANELIKQYGLSIILTIERRARGAAAAAPPVAAQAAVAPVPTRSIVTQNVVMQPMAPSPQQPPQKAFYQPFDMTGKPSQMTSYSPQVRLAARPHPQQRAPVIDPNYQTAEARVYDPPPTVGPRYQPPPPPAQPLPTPAPQPYAPAVDGQTYIPEEDKLDGPVQSRTFKILQSLMENEGPGQPPPPVSLDHKPQRPGRSVVHTQFNSPMGLYNDRTVVNTLENKMDKFSLREPTSASKLSQNESKPYVKSNSEVWRLVQEMDDDTKNSSPPTSRRANYR